jgi:hypothetical protein
MGRQFGGATKIQDGAVTTSKLADGAVTNSKLAKQSIKYNQNIVPSYLAVEDDFLTDTISAATYIKTTSGSGSFTADGGNSLISMNTGTTAGSFADLKTQVSFIYGNSNYTKLIAKFKVKYSLTAANLGTATIGFENVTGTKRMLIRHTTTTTNDKAHLRTTDITDSISAEFDFAEDVWHEVKLTWQSGSVAVNVDGVDVMSTSSNVPSVVLPVNVGISSSASSNANQNIQVDYWRVWVE